MTTLYSQANPGRIRIPKPVLDDTFSIFRDCGLGKKECQALWVGHVDDPHGVTEVVHPKHHARGDGFVLDTQWLHEFSLWLGKDKKTVRVQVHTHPGRAFHSPTDDAWPVVSSSGFLSLVIPNFALGVIGFAGAYLTEMTQKGWSEIHKIDARLELID